MEVNKTSPFSLERLCYNGADGITGGNSNRRQIEKSATEGESILHYLWRRRFFVESFFFRGRGENFMELSFSTHCYQIILLHREG